MLLEIIAGKAGASEAKLHSDKAYTEHGRENMQRTIWYEVYDEFQLFEIQMIKILPNLQAWPLLYLSAFLFISSYPKSEGKTTSELFELMTAKPL